MLLYFYIFFLTHIFSYFVIVIGGEGSDCSGTGNENDNNHNVGGSSDGGDQKDDTSKSGCGKLVVYFILHFLYFLTISWRSFTHKNLIFYAFYTQILRNTSRRQPF